MILVVLGYGVWISGLAFTVFGLGAMFRSVKKALVWRLVYIH